MLTTPPLSKNLLKILRAYLELSKPQITRTVIFTTGIGYYVATLGTDLPVQLWHVFSTLFSTTLLCAASCALNHVLEAGTDQQMSRTKSRPIPSSTISKRHAIFFATAIATGGLYLMVKDQSVFFALCALLTLLMYDFIYTPLKKVSAINTTVGAIPGALPILAGYIAGGGTDLLIGTLLFAVLFFWQHPHFYAIAWMYREDYERGGYKMISLGDEGAKRTLFASLLASALLLISSSLLFFGETFSTLYLALSFVLGVWFMFVIYQNFRRVTNRKARRIVVYSVIYLPLWLVIVAADQLMP